MPPPEREPWDDQSEPTWTNTPPGGTPRPQPGGRSCFPVVVLLLSLCAAVSAWSAVTLV